MASRGFSRLFIVSGLSGAGKSQVMNYLEDSGYFCIDNFPPYLMVSLVEKLLEETEIKNLALAIDIRGGRLLAEYDKAMNSLDSMGIPYETLFMEASDLAIISRYKLTRRRHPLVSEGEGDIVAAIARERRELAEIKGRVDRIIDTTGIPVSQLRRIMGSILDEEGAPRFLATLYSFGYKYGLPVDADLVMDVRFLPNPYYREDLKTLTGEDPFVQEYVFSFPETSEFLERYVSLLRYLIPRYMEEGKRQLVIAIGCTGGQHRSVALTNALADAIREPGIRTYVYHKELWRYRQGEQADVL